MVRMGSSRHVDAVFAELERSTDDPMRLYRCLLQCAVAQLDASAADTESLREKVFALQCRRREQSTELQRLQQRFKVLKERVRRVAEDAPEMMSTVRATGEALSLAVASPHANRHSREFESKHDLVEGRGLRGPATHHTVPLLAETCGSNTPLNEPSASSFSPPELTGRNSEEGEGVDDVAGIERVLSALLLFVLDDDPSNGSIDEMRPRCLNGNASELFDALLFSIKTLRQRESALKHRVKQLEEKCSDLKMVLHQCGFSQFKTGISPIPHSSEINDDRDSNNICVFHGYTTCSLSSSSQVARPDAVNDNANSDAMEPLLYEVEGGRSSSLAQSDNPMVEDLAGDTEMMEYAQWKQIFIREFLPS